MVTEASVPYPSSSVAPEAPVVRRNPSILVESSSSDVSGGDHEIPNEASAATLRTFELKQLVLKRFEKFHKIAIASHDRVPIRRPRDKIPAELLQIGNDILASKVSERFSNGMEYLSKLNAAVYGIARAIAATAEGLSKDPDAPDPKRALKEAQEFRGTLLSHITSLTNELQRRKAWKRGERNRPSRKYLEIAEAQDLSSQSKVRRYLRQLKDRLETTKDQIRNLEGSLRRQSVRRKGFSVVVRERADRPSDVPVTSVREYWAPIVGKEKAFQVSRELKDWSDDLGTSDTPSRSQELSEEQWRSLFGKVKPWKATGPDGIQGFWWKHLPAARSRLVAWCRAALSKPRRMVPAWLCQGRVVLIPKVLKGDQSTRGPGDFRPIACLNTCYKILTASMSTHVLRTIGDRFPREQIALRKGVWSCTHAQALDQTIVKDALRHKKELHMLWVDLTKAFDSLSHGAIRWTIKQWGVPSDLRRLLSVIMSMQSVRYFGYSNGKLVKSPRLKIRNGLMQGDTLSPLLFCLAIAPVSHWIRSHVRPYESRTGAGNRSDGTLTLGHILYMDDLKIFTPDSGDMALAEGGIRRVFGQLGLELNARKCATRSLNCATANVAQLDEIPALGASEFYKYLGAEQNSLVCVGELWDRVESVAKATARRLFSSDLTVRQMVNGYNQVVIPKLKYAISCVIFGAGKLSTLKKRALRFDVDIRKVMEESHLRFGSSCTARLYVDKELGGLGMKSVVEELEKSITYSWCYLATNTDLLVPYELAESLRASGKRSITSDFEKVLATNELVGRVKRNILATITVDSRTFFNATEAARAITALIRARWSKVHLTAWKSKEVASRVIQERGRNGEQTPGLCLKDSFLWSVRGWVSAEVLRNVWAVQEGSLLTRNSAAGRACMPQARGLCRMHCSPNALETAEHIVSACSHWRTNIMVERHDDVARVLYSAIRRKYNVKATVNTHEPHVVDLRHVVIHWNDSIWTSEGLAHNRPDLLVWDKVAKRIWIVEISVSWFTRVPSQEQRKLGKYGVNSTLPEETAAGDFYPGPNLKSVLQRDRKCRVDVIPIVVGACGEVTPNLRRYINDLELPDSTDVLIERIERAAVLGTNRLVKCHLAN
ncbi:reverse transcriptase [Ancylostoma duodenale]|uniref:Reverse transcriptase n=1 Tax=Ancylostoma duodenale TaxID=51022 RepID=A0A0C2D4C8_9BILA|nr:reverse transcriptase [Ancylostoma duodenale]